MSKKGSSPVFDPDGNLNLSGSYIKNLAEPQDDSDAATKIYVDNNAGSSYTAGTGLSLSSEEFSLDESYGATWSSQHSFDAGISLPAGQSVSLGSESIQYDDVLGNIIVSGPLSMDSDRITNVATPQNSDDAATMGYVDNNSVSSMGGNLESDLNLNGYSIVESDGNTILDISGMGMDATLKDDTGAVAFRAFGAGERVIRDQNGNDHVYVNNGGSTEIKRTLDMMSNSVRNVATPQNESDAATKGYVDNNSGGKKVSFEAGHTQWASGLIDEEIHRFSNPDNDFTLEQLEFLVKGGGSANAEIGVGVDGRGGPGGLTQTLTESGNSVMSVDWNDDYIAYGDSNGNVYVHNISDWSLETSLTSDLANGVEAIRFGHGYLACAEDTHYQDGGGDTYVYNTSDWSLETTLTDSPSDSGVRHVAFSPDGNYIAQGVGDGHVYVHNLSDWSLATTLTQDGLAVEYVMFRNGYIYYGGYDNTVYIHNVSDWSLETSLGEATDAVQNIDVSDNYVYYASVDTNVYVHNTSDWSLETTLSESSDYSQSLDAHGDYISYGNRDSNVYIHNVGDWSLDTTLTEAGDYAASVKWHNEYIAYGSFDNTVYIHEASVIPVASVSAGSTDNTTHTIEEDPVKIRLTTNEEVTGSPIVRGEIG